MLSDPRVVDAFKAVSVGTRAFRVALAATLEQVERYLAAASPGAGQVARFGAELGRFGEDRINADRFAALFGDERSIDPLTIEGIELAARTLRELAARGDELFAVNVAPGACLRGAVAKAIEQIGRVFAAARAVESSQASGGALPASHVHALEAFPFRSWSRLQRLLAPPLIVRAEGGDLYAGGLAEFLDGSQKIVIAVSGECSPAPLVRLITAGVWVMQTTDPAALGRLAGVTGPAAVALVPAGAAQFVHDPTGGAHPWERLRVTHLPDGKSLKAIGGISAFQQAEELDQLRALAARPAAVSAETAAAAATRAEDSVDKLASWLISQAELE